MLSPLVVWTAEGHAVSVPGAKVRGLLAHLLVGAGELDLLACGRPVRDAAAALGIAESCLHCRKSQDLRDRGIKSPTLEAVESAALAAARARVAELENEVTILRKAASAVEEVVFPKARFVLVAELAAEGVPIKQACLALGVSRSGFYASLKRPPARCHRQEVGRVRSCSGRDPASSEGLLTVFA